MGAQRGTVAREALPLRMRLCGAVLATTPSISLALICALTNTLHLYLGTSTP